MADGAPEDLEVIEAWDGPEDAGLAGAVCGGKESHFRKELDLAYLCLIRMSEHYRNHPVITVDGDFRIYRRNRREVIPVLMPSG
mgnify:CR=1 FL=1